MIKKINDTIVAISTPRGKGGIGIIRLSGSKAYTIANIITKKKFFIVDCIERTSFFGKNDVLLDFGLLLYFKKPKSFTGEDVIELHTHGSDLILDSILIRAIELGARLAEPGEFSFRSFFNGKIDLLQAESVNSLIKSNVSYYNNFILKSLSGAFSNEINMIMDKLLLLRRDLEAFIEFPDDITFSFKEFSINFNEFMLFFDIFFDKLYTNCFVTDFFKITILGNVNVGKSSLFNLLLKKDRAITSNIPGTTRDFLESDFSLDGVNFKLVDTAGFNDKSQCLIEQNGITKTFEQLEEASIIIFMFDINKISDIEIKIFQNVLNNYESNSKIFLLKNKIDLINLKEKIVLHNKYIECYLSVRKNIGINLFLNKLKHVLFDIKDTSYMVNKRHYSLLLKVKKCLLNIDINKNDFSFDILAENLKNAYIFLSEILGKNFSESLINEIFSKFCIGK